MGQLSILLVCDNNQLSEKLTHFVATLGQQVGSLDISTEALEYIGLKKPNIVIINENLSDTTAQDFIVKASQKKLFTTTVFVLATKNQLNENDKIRYMTLGFSSFITIDFKESDQNDLNNFIKEEIIFQNAA